MRSERSGFVAQCGRCTCCSNMLFQIERFPQLPEYRWSEDMNRNNASERDSTASASYKKGLLFDQYTI